MAGGDAVGSPVGSGSGDGSGITLLPATAPARGGAVLVHGLNTTPDVMAELATALRAGGYHCALPSLPRAARPREDPDRLAAAWSAAVDEAVQALRSSHADLPCHGVGFSLGGLLCLLAAGRRQPGPFERLVLWAPPLALTRTASAVRLLTPLHRSGLALPSAAPRTDRAAWATPLTEYSALLRLVDGAGRLPADVLAATPALVLLEPGDELVSDAGVRAWVRRRGLPSWSVEPVRHHGRGRRTYRHMVVREQALGTQQWRGTVDRLLAHLAGGAPTGRP